MFTGTPKEWAIPSRIPRGASHQAPVRIRKELEIVFFDAFPIIDVLVTSETQEVRIMRQLRVVLDCPHGCSFPAELAESPHLEFGKYLMQKFIK